MFYRTYRHVDHVPCAGRYVVVEVDVAHIVEVVESKLVGSVHPRAEYHLAHLLIERKVLDVDLTRRLEDRRRYPRRAAHSVQHHVGLVADIVALGTLLPARALV